MLLFYSILLLLDYYYLFFIITFIINIHIIRYNFMELIQADCAFQVPLGEATLIIRRYIPIRTQETANA